MTISLMEKEIFEQPEILKELATGDFKLEPFNFDKIYVAASGSSKNCADISKYFLEKILKKPMIVETASEFAHRDVPISSGDLFIALSQSGTTADTLEALKKAQNNGLKTLSITNSKGSPIYECTDEKILINAGEEKSITATKSFIAMLFRLYQLGIKLSRENSFLEEMSKISKNIEEVLKTDLAKIVGKLYDKEHLVILGRGNLSAVANEAALKLKESCYIDANGYAAGEFMHGHIAFTDERTPVLFMISNNSENYELSLKNLEKLLDRGLDITIIKDSKDTEIEKKYNADFINIPINLNSYFQPFCYVVLFQLLALQIAYKKGLNPDKPRGLKKSLDEE